MSESITRNTECRVTKSAWERLLPSVGKCVPKHVAFVRSYLVANCATPHLNSMLIELLNLKYFREWNFIFGLILWIGLFTIGFMPGLVGWKLKCLTTKLAQIVPLFSVNNNVSLPILFETKSLSTKTANPFMNWTKFSHPCNLLKQWVGFNNFKH